MTANFNRWIFQIPIEDVRNSDVYNTDPLEECFCCGKKVKNPTYVIHLLTSGHLVSTLEPFDEREDQGFFTIGNDCKNRLPNNFTFKKGLLN